jgi:hypothetical protein
MSTTWKLGMAAICATFSAFLLGGRLAESGTPSWRAWAAAIALAVCLLAFLWHLLALHATLTHLAQQHRPLRQPDGRLVIP